MSPRAILDSMLGTVMLAAAAFAQDTIRASVDSNGVEANFTNFIPSLSADGHLVAFESLAWNLVANDNNGAWDIFVHDRSTGVTERVSVDGAGGEGNRDSSAPSLSADGRFVAFVSDATNLVVADTNKRRDVFVHDRTTGATERVSVDSSGAEANGDCWHPSISSDGRFVAFSSGAANLVAGDRNGFWDVFVHDRATGITERVNVDAGGAEANAEAWYQDASISADGTLVAFTSFATNLVAGDANGVGDAFVHDRSTGLTERVSVTSNGSEADSESKLPMISADGRFVTFESFATNLVAGDLNHVTDVFVHDRTTGTTERVSVDSSGKEATLWSQYPAISGDGQFVTFSSFASELVAGDTGFHCDQFIHDRTTGSTERASVDSAGVQGNNDSGSIDFPAISSNGNAVAFSSHATNLVAGDKNSSIDVFVHEFCATQASWSNYGAGFPGTNGVPTFTARANPVFGTTLTLDLSNSYGSSSVGVVGVGYQRASIHLDWGGDLLLLPMFLFVVRLPAAGVSGFATVPDDRDLCGLAVDLQALEFDPGAAKGVSFTDGLELVIGR